MADLALPGGELLGGSGRSAEPSVLPLLGEQAHDDLIAELAVHPGRTAQPPSTVKPDRVPAWIIAAFSASVSSCRRRRPSTVNP
ncbi:hypothetical protein [Kitasatospora acidiphila]|uniref:hypothetical protein n=1 Tax=Kitasatospora acidiphila TaxID=2567942 RepID=UPI002B400171|nr:hypothetical protein [Kitasatospora acidiphila]